MQKFKYVVIQTHLFEKKFVRNTLIVEVSLGIMVAMSHARARRLENLKVLHMSSGFVRCPSLKMEVSVHIPITWESPADALVTVVYVKIAHPHALYLKAGIQH